MSATSDPSRLPAPGVYRQNVRLSPPSLSAWEWPTIEIVGERPGPRIAIWAGMHVNELSSVEAAFRLARTLDPSAVLGRVSIMPILDLPALGDRTSLVCPLDDKNINFCFPGSPSGTFSDALAYALINEWAADAICTFDLHGGDVSEDVDQYIMIQLTGDSQFDAELRTVADGWGAKTRMEFPPRYMETPGRSITARSAQAKFSIMSEAGCSTRISESDVAFHAEGVLGIAAKLGVVDATRIDVPASRMPQIIVRESLVVHSDVRGWGKTLKVPGEPVKKGDVLVEVRDYVSDEASYIRSPHDGIVMWTDHHPAVEPGHPVGGLGVFDELKSATRDDTDVAVNTSAGSRYGPTRTG